MRIDFRIIPMLLLAGCMTISAHAQRPIKTPAEAAGSLFITEVNRSESNSGFGDAVEILNASPYTWSLNNCFVSDATPDGALESSGDTYLFPNGTSIAPYEMLVVFLERWDNVVDVQTRLNTLISTSSLAAPAGVRVFVPQSEDGLPAAGLTFRGVPVGRMQQIGTDVSGGTIDNGVNTIVLGFRSTLPAPTTSTALTVLSSDVIDGFAWSETGAAAGTSMTWGPGATDNSFLATDSTTRPDSFKRAADASGTRPVDTNSAADWSISGATNLNYGRAAWAPRAITTPADAVGLLVTEVNRSGSTNSKIGGEFFEVVNNSNFDYSLANLFIGDNSTSGTDTAEGAQSFPQTDVFPARSTLVLLNDDAADITTSTFRNIPTTNTLTPGGILVYSAANKLTTNTTSNFFFGGVPVRPVRTHGALSLSNGGDNIHLGVKTGLVPNTVFPVTGAMVVDGMGYLEGTPANGDWTGWGTNVVTTSGSLNVLTTNATRPDAFRRTTLLDTNTAADWTITTASANSTPGIPPVLLTGTLPTPTAARAWQLFE